MKNKSWGQHLLNLYRLLLLLFFLFSGFNFWHAVVLGSYPLMLLFRLNTELTVYIHANFGYYGFSILCILIQGEVLQYAGNAIEKLFLKKSEKVLD